MWQRGTEGNPDVLVPVIRDVTLGFENEITFSEKVSWRHSENRTLKSSLPISQFILSKGKITTLLMKETPDGQLVPLVTRDKKMLNDITPLLENLTKEKDNEIIMLKGVIESQQEQHTKQLTTYYDTYQQILKGYQSLAPLVLKSLTQRTDLFRQFVRKDFSEHDIKTLIEQSIRDAELELLDRFKQETLDAKYSSMSSPPFTGSSSGSSGRKRIQKSPRKEQPPEVEETSEGEPVATDPFAQVRALQQQAQAQQQEQDDRPQRAVGPEDMDDFIDALKQGKVEHEMPSPPTRR